MTRLTGKTCLVTGGANGIGAAISRALAREGARVAITDIDDDMGRRLAAEIGVKARYLHHDVTDEESWERVFRDIADVDGTLDVMVNNAGGGTYNDVESLSLAEWRRIISLNADSAFLGTRGAIRAMRERGGSIINIASVASFIGAPTLAAYSAGKGAVLMLTKSAATWCGTRGYGIRVNSVHPGLVETKSGMEMARQATGAATDEDAARAFTQLHPIGRLGRPDDIAGAVVFLASDESAFMTGSAVVVDGGFTAL